MQLSVSITQDEDGLYIAECPSIPGCVSQGVSENEALLNIQDAIHECIETRKELGMPLTVNAHNIEIEV